jgi:hypothetical protein
MSPQVMLFLLQAMFWAGFGDPGRPPPCFSVSSLACSLSACAARLFPLPTGTPRKSLAASWLPASCPQNKSHKTPQRAANKHGNVVVRWSMLSLSLCPCVEVECDARRPSREQKVGWWARRHFTTRKRTHLELTDGVDLSLHAICISRTSDEQSRKLRSHNINT